jgi:indole-3-acetate monooxygenase
MDGDRPRLTPAGRPEHRLVFVPVNAATIIDTWQTGGLRGTASHDFAIRDCFVPESKTCRFSDAPIRPEPLFQLNQVALFATFVASVPVGIARHAIELFVHFAGGKTPTWSQGPLSERASAQSSVGQAEGLVRSGRAFLTDALRDAWVTVTSGGTLSWEQRGMLFLASTQAATQAVRAVELLYSAAGASAVYSDVGFERCLRDVAAAAQHLAVTPMNFELAGQLSLGMDVSKSVWSIDSR